MSLQSIALESACARSARYRPAGSGLHPQHVANMVHAPALLETYLVGYRLFRREAGFTPGEQEVVFLSISFENECAYCMAAHSSIADTKSRVPPAVTEALRRGEPVPDATLNALSRFTRALVVKRGRPSREELAAFLAAGYRTAGGVSRPCGGGQDVQQLFQPSVRDKRGRDLLGQDLGVATARDCAGAGVKPASGTGCDVMSLVPPQGHYATTAAAPAERMGRLDKSAGRWMMAGCEPGG